nr:MAG TPA: hypothetical protein [Bacteriophage sp.]
MFLKPELNDLFCTQSFTISDIVSKIPSCHCPSH